MTKVRARGWMLLGPAFVAAIAYVDPGNVAAIHLVGGLWGTLAAGLLKPHAIPFSQRLHDFGLQALGAVSAIVLALAGASMTCVADTPAAHTMAARAAASSLAPTQLPRDVRPTHYDVSIEPHADKLSFDGQVTVDVQVLQPTTSTTLNALNMKFASVKLMPASLAIAGKCSAALVDPPVAATMAAPFSSDLRVTISLGNGPPRSSICITSRPARRATCARSG